MMIPRMTKWVYEQEMEIRKYRRQQMLDKALDGIRYVLRGIVGLNGYTIVDENKLAEDQAELEDLRKERRRLQQRIADIKNNQKLTFLKDYEYAIFVSRDTIVPRIWNDGRWEENVRTVTFIATPGAVPELTLRK